MKGSKDNVGATMNSMDSEESLFRFVAYHIPQQHELYSMSILRGELSAPQYGLCFIMKNYIILCARFIVSCDIHILE